MTTSFLISKRFSLLCLSVLSVIENEMAMAADKTPHSSLQTTDSSEDADSLLLTPCSGEAPDCSEAAGCGKDEIKHITEYSPYLDILKKAAMRAPADYLHPDQIAYSFTIEEMILLSKDAEFAEVFPDMAAEIRAEVVKMFGSG